MITGSFDTAVGAIRLEIADGGSSADMRITDIGSLSYDFDQTPESVTIDRVQALYNFLNVTILYQDEYGFDLWERLIDSAINLDKIPCTLTIDTWDGNSYQFLFKLRIADLSLSEINGTIQLKLNPNFDDEVDIDTVYASIDAGKKASFSKKSFSSSETQNNTAQPLSTETYTATGVKDWIDKALNEVFDNSFTGNVIKPSLVNLGSGYTDEVYDTLQSSGSKRQLLMLDIESTKFASSEDNTKLVVGTGTISIINPTTYTTTIFITGSGTDFTNEVEFGDYIVVNGITYGKIEDVNSSFLSFTYQWYDTTNVTNPQDEFPNFGVSNSSYSILKRQNVMQQPAIKALKDLAGMEGSVFGCGFSKNFYFNRLRGDAGEDITIDFDTEVIDINPKPYYLSLGTSLVSQRADFRRVGEKLYGSYGSTNPNINRQIPNLTDRGSITRGNANASKELKIELAPAYPMLNKGIRQGDGTYDGDDILFDVGLESALTANGLRSYFQALSSTSGNILIEITLLGAFRVKPWNTISFGATAPERYANKSFRPTSISYDLKNDTVKIKAYQIDTIYSQVLTDLGFNFVFGEQLLQEGLIQAVQAQTGEAINRIQQALFRTAAVVPAVLGNAIQRIDLITTGAGIGDSEPETGLFSQGDDLILFDPTTLNSERFTVAANQAVGQKYVLVQPKAITGQFPAGSYVYISQKNVTAGVKISENSVQIFNDTYLVGLLRASVDNVSATSLQVRLNEKIKAGTDLFLGDEKSGNIQSITVTNSIGPGDVTMNIEAENLKFPAGTRIYGSEAQKQAILQVDPFRVLTAVTQVKAQQAIATLNGALPIGTYTSIDVVSARTMTLLPSTIIMVQDRTGATQYFTTIASSQNLTGGTTSISVVSTTTTTALEDGASVLEPSWRQSSQITQLSNQIELRVTESRVQEIVDENLGGLLPAENFTFQNTDEGFVGNGVTLTNNTDYVEYLVTNDADPYMQRTVSYDADDNPVVTIFLQLIAGTLPASWNCRFGWTTDGSTYYEQAFVQPTNVANDFQFATIDLTSNVNYTGTITAIRLYLGADVDDEYYIGQFTIGKFNPQTEILTDLTNRITTAEGNITVNANEINSYVTGTQGLNRIATVTGTYGASSSYDEITLTNIRSGASVLNGQILILQNGDGSFQQVTADGDQDPLVSPLAINSITFSEDISNAVLFEPMYAATSRITQSAGQLVLKAVVSSGEITKLALVRLDATAAGGSEIFLQGNKIIVDGQTTFLNSLRTNGIAGKVDVSTTIRSTTAPTVRTDGSAIQAGDTWIKTDSGNLPYTYDGTSPFNVSGWIRDYTQIDGGNITTGTVDTDRLNVSNIITVGSIATETYADGVAQTAEDNANANISIVNYARQRVFRQDAKPTSSGRPDLGTGFPADVFLAGDIWIDTDDGDAPWTYDVSTSDFIRAYTRIDGGSIVTGTVDTNRLNVSNIITVGSIATETYADGVASQALSDAEDYADGVAETVSDATPRVFRQDAEPTTSNRSDNSLQAGDIWYKTDEGDLPHTYTGTEWQRSYTQIAGGNITTGTILADLVTIQNASATAGLIIDGDGILFRTPDPSFLGDPDKVTFGTVGDIYGVQSVEAVSPDIFVTRTLFLKDNRSVSGSILRPTSVVVDFDILNSKGIIESEGEIKAFNGIGIYNTSGASSGDFRAKIVYDVEEDVTLTIPNVGGNRTFAFIDQAQTFTEQQSFPHQGIRIENSTSEGFYATLQHTTADNRTYTFPSESGTFALIDKTNTFTSEQIINADLKIGSSGTNQSVVFATQDGDSNDITVALSAQNGGTSGNKFATIPNATGTLVTTADYNQDIAGTKRFTGTLRASEYRSEDNSIGQSWTVRLIDSDNNQYDVEFKQGILTSVTAY